MTVNSYRFIAMYLLIGMLVGTLTAFSQDNSDVTGAYDLETEKRIVEIADKSEDILDDSETLVQSNQFVLSSNFGDERSLGRNWWEIFRNGFFPTGLIPEDYIAQANPMERGLNQLIIWFRWIILLFAGYELFQMLLRKVT